MSLRIISSRTGMQDAAVKPKEGIRLRNLAENLNVNENQDDMLSNILIWMGWWFNGETGMDKNISARRLDESTMYLRAIGETYGRPAIKRAYRLTSIRTEGKKILEGQSIKAIIAPRNIMSFSTDPSYPAKFYNLVYRDRNIRKDKRFQYVVVEKDITPQNYVCSIDNCTTFLDDILSLDPNRTPATRYTGMKHLERQLAVWAGKIRRTLGSKFYQMQREVILDIPQPTKCVLYQVL